jgi:hypothetical protein
MINNMDMANLYGLMEEHIREIGKTVNKMVKESTCNLTAKKKLAYGPTERISDG